MRILKYRKRNRANAVNARRHRDNAERVQMHVTKGDNVLVMRGDSKGMTGEIIRVYSKTGRITVKGVNIVKKHRKARKAEEQSGIIEMEAPIRHSNVMLLDPKSGKAKATRTRMRIDADGTKERISIKSGEAIPRNR